jgi:phytoene dehydrogenase-like protein
VDDAPLVNAALGVTIRGAGLARARGGMRGFWTPFATRYEALGGRLVLGTVVRRVEEDPAGWRVGTSRGDVVARQVVAALPAEVTARIGPLAVAERLAPYLRRDARARGGALAVFLGVPEEEVADSPWTHHQILEDYDAPLGMGNNMFVSVSPPGDVESAPAGFRAITISTHCELSDWKGLDERTYAARKRAAGERLVSLARRVLPRLGSNAVVREVGTPVTYARFTRRPDGAVGGARLSLRNANQRAIPHGLGVPGFHLVGDTTWPGLGTVACVLGSRIVARRVLAFANKGATVRSSFFGEVP